MSIREQLIHNTIRIESFFKGGEGTGTGFFFQFDVDNQEIPCIITNKHVVKDPKLGGALKGKLTFKLKDSQGKWDVGKKTIVEINNFAGRWIMHPDDNIDLCIYPIAPLLTEISKGGKNPFFISIQENLIPTSTDEEGFTALEEILMVGYPNGIWDEKNNLPILRKGITATPISYDYGGKEEFLIDAACFPGSSGSPVFLLNLNGYSDKKGNTILGGVRIKFLGILYSGFQYTAAGGIQIVNVPTVQKLIPLITIPNNLGVIIKSKKIQEFKKIIELFLKK